MTGAASDAKPADTQQHHGNKLVHCDATNAATENMTLDTHLKMDLGTGSRKNMKHHAIGCEQIHIEVDGHHLPIGCTAGLCRDCQDRSIAACNGKPAWPTL